MWLHIIQELCYKSSEITHTTAENHSAWLDLKKLHCAKSYKYLPHVQPELLGEQESNHFIIVSDAFGFKTHLKVSIHHF